VPIGTGVFIPSGRFATPRSYIRGIVFNIAGYTVFDDGDHWSWVENGGSAVFVIVPDPRFHAWSSNRWTYDHMFVEFYHTLVPGGTKFPDDYSLRPHTHPVSGERYIEFRFGTVDFGALVYMDMPPANLTYWFPPFSDT
jgi:hypothetical protein